MQEACDQLAVPLLLRTGQRPSEPYRAAAVVLEPLGAHRLFIGGVLTRRCTGWTEDQGGAAAGRQVLREPRQVQQQTAAALAKEAWLSDGRHVLHLRPVQPVPLRKRHLEMSREEPLSL